VLRTLIVSGNRPSAVLAARVCDLADDRIKLPLGAGKKSNGASILPPDLVAILRLQSRGRGGSAPLLLSAEGCELDLNNLNDRTFRPAVVLAVVKENWPHGRIEAREAEPVEVAQAIVRGKPASIGCVPTTDPAKIEARQRHQKAVAVLAGELHPVVTACLHRRPLYAFIRHTHQTLAAKAGVHPYSIDAQIGHKPEGVGGGVYTDLAQVDPAASSP
jgi:hypothetical protein